MNGYVTTHATPQRPARLRRWAVRVAAPVLVLSLAFTAAAVPAQAATTATSAGATWSKLMYRKLTLKAQSAALTASLPGLRTTAATRNSALAQALQARTATATTLATAATADQTARSRYETARAAVAVAKNAVIAARKTRPRSTSGITTSTQALTAANATVQARAATVRRTTSAWNAAQTAYTTAVDQVATATTAYQSAITAVSDTRLRITALLKLDVALAAQAATISRQVVTEARGSFTTADTRQVYGITVNKIVAFSFQRMIDDAAKAGVQLSGGGFRTTQRQIALRTVNGCPDVWTAPASSCKVPTAIPGRSLHEIGLAIDLTSGRKTITDRRSAAFTWLAANAGRYGFVNLPSEPWHWSITGG